ncbi:MAG: hypothetical protein ACRETL_03940 [Gammaproteobacteria bacterium]
MDAAHGTPTVWQKVAVKLGFGKAIGMTDQEIADTLAGEQHDVTQGEQVLLGLFAPILHAAEGAGLSDLQTFLTDALKGAASITSVAGGVAFAKSELANEGGTIKTQAEGLGETAFTTFISAILTSIGHVSLPAS